MKVPSPEWTKVVEDSQACKESNKLERLALSTSGYEYDIDDEMVAELEELDGTGMALEKHCTNLAEMNAKSEASNKALDDHRSQCPECKPYFDQVQINRQELHSTQ